MPPEEFRSPSQRAKIAAEELAKAQMEELAEKRRTEREMAEAEIKHAPLL